MAIIKKYRKDSSTKYVQTAGDIYDTVADFVMSMSPKFYGSYGKGLCALAGEVHDNIMKGYDAYDDDDMKKEMRRRYFLQAKVAIKALDSKLGICWDKMCSSPNKAIQNALGEFLSAEDALQTIAKTADKIGKLINTERKLVKSFIDE